MATVKVVDLIARAQALLKDPSAVRWTVIELQYWLNDSYREIVNLRPDANAQTGTFSCTSGYRQTLTSSFATAQRLLDIVANTATLSNKKAVILVDRKSMDMQRPGWYNETASINIQSYMFDPRLPKQFLVYPPATTTARLEVVYSALPTSHTLTAEQLASSETTEVIKLDDSYANAILDYIMYRAYTKDSEQANNAQLAAAHYQAMAASLGVKTQSDQTSQPGVS